MSKQSYMEKLQDPRWQKMRLQVLERDKWACCICEAKDRTLHVHHRVYFPGYEPWEYALSVMETRCDACHKNIRRDELLNDDSGEFGGCDEEVLLSEMYEFWGDDFIDLAYTLQLLRDQVDAPPIVRDMLLHAFVTTPELMELAWEEYHRLRPESSMPKTWAEIRRMEAK